MSKLQTKKPKETNVEKPWLFKPGNKLAEGHGGASGWLARMRAAMRERVPEEVFMAMIDAQVEKAADGDTAAFIAVRDTIGLKPKDELDVTSTPLINLTLHALAMRSPELQRALMNLPDLSQEDEAQ